MSGVTESPRSREIYGPVVSQYSCFTLNPFFIGGGSTLPHEAWFQVTACSPSCAGWKTMGRLDRLTLHGIEGDRDLAAGIDPMAKQGRGAIARIFCNRRCTILTQAQVHRRTTLLG